MMFSVLIMATPAKSQPFVTKTTCRQGIIYLFSSNKCDACICRSSDAAVANSPGRNLPNMCNGPLHHSCFTNARCQAPHILHLALALAPTLAINKITNKQLNSCNAIFIIAPKKHCRNCVMTYVQFSTTGLPKGAHARSKKAKSRQATSACAASFRDCLQNSL